MKRPFSLLLTCAVFIVPRLAFAEPLPSPYEAEVLVASQTEEARHASLISALQAVAVKLSGNSEVGRSPVLAEALKNPERYVEQFRYVGDAAATQSLWVRFDARALEQLLQSRGLPLWSLNRPAVVAWLGVDEKGRRSVIGTGDDSPVAAAMQTVAVRRGLPLHFPLMDLEDRGRIQPGDLWGDFGANIQAASVRYRAQAVLSGAVTKVSDSLWRARWTLYREGAARRSWEVTGSLEVVAATGVDTATDELARASAAAPAPIPGAPLALRVAGVRSLDEFTRVNDYLRGLTGVTAVQPIEVTGDQLVIGVAYQGGSQGLAQAIALGSTLAPVQGADPTAEFSYRLLP